MACNVGSANADIAGLGIMISFAFQAGLSILLSICSLVLWRTAVTSRRSAGQLVFGSAHATAAERAAGAREVNRAFLTSVIDILEKYRPESRFKQISENFLAELDQHQAQEDATLNTKLSAIKLRWLVGERAAMKKKCIDSVLATISDVQVINAMGLLIAALIQHETLSLYHLRVVYDTSSFTGISVCASLINVSTDAGNLRRTRAFTLVAYICTFISFSAVFGTKLKNWDQGVVGRCYNTGLIATPHDMHPLADMMYLGFTCFYSICALLSCYRSGFAFPALACLLKRPFQSDLARRFTRKLGAFLKLLRLREFIKQADFFLSVAPPDAVALALRYIAGYFALLAHPRPEYRVWALMPLAMAQYTLHLYMAIAIRKGNEVFLEGDSENDWGFGQIVALVLCVATCIECIRGLSEYRKAVGAEPVQPPATQTPGQIV